MAELTAKLEGIFRDVFDEPTLKLRDDMTAADVAGWDSLAHINLIIAIERNLAIKFATAEISKMKEPGQNVGSFVRLIENKVTGKRR